MKNVELRNVTLEKSRMHISGAGTQYNAPGNRNFTILFNPDTDMELVDKLISQNWPISKKEDDYGLKIRLKVIVKYTDFSSPRFTMLMKKPAIKNGKQYLEDPEGAAVAVPINQVSECLDNGWTMLYNVSETELDQEASKAIDNYDISNVKVKINLSTYTKADGSVGYCTYLQEMQFVKNPSAFEHDLDSLDISVLHPEIAGEFDSSLPFDS